MSTGRGFVAAYSGYTWIVIATEAKQPERLLIFAPTWVGDIVMATPAIRALRHRFPDVHLAVFMSRSMQPLLEHCPWINEIIVDEPQHTGHALSNGRARRARLFEAADVLKKKDFDTVVLLPNSFRSALVARLSSIPRRVGYTRDGRSFLLTDRLIPRQNDRKFIPTPTLLYYLALAQYLGADEADRSMELFTSPSDDAAADEVLKAAGYSNDEGRPFVLLNPGANFGDAKMYFPSRFAAVADRCTKELDAIVAVTGAPKERRILDDVIAAAKCEILDLQKHGMNLRVLKSVMRRADLLITNDTGPRHIAAAFKTPVVTIFGPTDPAWTTIDFIDERILRVDVDCGPCQRKRCPLTGGEDELICMKRISTDMVFDAAAELLKRAKAGPVAAGEAG